MIAKEKVGRRKEEFATLEMTQAESARPVLAPVNIFQGPHSSGH